MLNHQSAEENSYYIISEKNMLQVMRLAEECVITAGSRRSSLKEWKSFNW